MGMTAPPSPPCRCTAFCQATGFDGTIRRAETRRDGRCWTARCRSASTPMSRGLPMDLRGRAGHARRVRIGATGMAFFKVTNTVRPPDHRRGPPTTSCRRRPGPISRSCSASASTTRPCARRDRGISDASISSHPSCATDRETERRQRDHPVTTPSIPPSVGGKSAGPPRQKPAAAPWRAGERASAIAGHNSPDSSRDSESDDGRWPTPLRITTTTWSTPAPGRWSARSPPTVMAVGVVIWMKGLFGLPARARSVLFFAGLAGVLYTMSAGGRTWSRKPTQGDHTPVVSIGLRYGMMLFIASEVMFFVGLVLDVLRDGPLPRGARPHPGDRGGPHAAWSTWPPKGVETWTPGSCRC